jgi:TolA-binding protein
MVFEGKTRRVHVDEGLVELRLRAYGTVRLGPDDTWQEPAAAAEPSRPKVVASTQARDSSAPVKAIATTKVDEDAKLYANAMNLLRARENDEAAAAFHAFATAHPHATQAEDASFLEAVALARAGRPDAAGLAAERHLTAFPSSFHRREAAILVARAARLRGDCAAARAAVAPWLEADADSEALAALHGCELGR